MKTYRHIIFDLDHTLWDFEANSRVALELIFHTNEIGVQSNKSLAHFLQVYEEINKRYWFLYHNRKVDKETLRLGRFSETLKKMGIDDIQMAGHLASEYLELSPKQTRLIPGAMDVLEYLRNKGYVLHLMTNGFSEVQRIKIVLSGLEPFFDQLLISEETGFQKPMKEAFDLLLLRASAESQETLMVGDNLDTDIAGARTAGIDQVWLSAKGNAGKVKPTYRIKQLAELKSIL